MPYPSLVWSGLVIIGGLLLIAESKLTKMQYWGVGLIFFGFLFQTAWEVSHPWVPTDSLIQLIFIAVFVLSVLSFIVWPRRSRK